MSTIELQNLTIGYSEKGNSKTVASNINATLRSGCLTCLVGSNGIGKSTLLRTLSAFQPMLSGNIVVDGRPLSDFSDQELSHVIGIVLTGKPDVQNMTVEDIVALGRSPYTGFWGTLDDDDKAVVEESMSLVGITHLRSRMIQTLSDGERQKMMIAKALAQQTPVIFLDEPTAFLDYPSKVEMLQLLRRLSHDTDKIIFLSTHDMELALQIADELWLMAPDGISLGTPQQLADNGKLSAFINRPGITFDTRTLTIKITAS